MTSSFSIQNFGCRVNQAEAFSWAEEFELHGFRLEEDSGRADVVVVNTCTLTSRADRDVRKFLRRVCRENPGAKLVVAGCSVENGKVEFQQIPQAWLVLSNEEKRDLVARTLTAVKERPQTSFRPLRSRALLKVQDGCNFRCAFCVIPRVRGRSRSVPKEDILVRARKFIEQGFHEIVLCGIHLSSFGLDLEPRRSLLELLRELVGLDGLGKIRLSSLDPRSMDGEFLDFISGSPNICPHFHLSLQHGSDRILKKMGRESTATDYRRLLSRLRQGSAEASLGADLMVGFPGEEQEDVEAMTDFLMASPLTYFHVFGYSPRPGTPAERWEQVPEHLKRERSAQLRKLSQEKRLAFRRTFLGRELEGIVVKKHEAGAEILTSNYFAVRVLSCPSPPGEEVKVKITRVEPNRTGGEIVLPEAELR